jgi:Xaa-Pro aminopeptidase
MSHKLGKPDIAAVQKCTISNLQDKTYFLDHAIPIKAEEFIRRRDRLAVALHESEVDAFALEPGYTFQYYGNISQTDWEPWEPEERPFLMIVRPEIHDGVVKARTTFLSPHFEEGRVRMLGIPSSEEELEIAVWEEHWDPYSTLRWTTFNNATGAKIMVDEEMRDYIVRGLDGAGFQTVGLNTVVDSVRQRKSAAEVELLRAVNTGTVEAVRQMRPCEYYNS